MMLYLFVVLFLYYQDKRKDALKVRKEKLELDQNEKEKMFLESLHEAHEVIFEYFLIIFYLI